jgi:hypothetical protein
MKSFLIGGLFFWAFIPLIAQNNPRFFAELSQDSVLMGHTFELKYTLENAPSVQFQPPTIQGFDLVSGPMTSSVMNMINGQTTQRVTYTYVLLPRGEGEYFLPSASAQVDGETLRTEQLPIVVLSNPEGIPQSKPTPMDMNGMGMDFFRDFLQPDLEGFSFPGFPPGDSLRSFPDMEQFFEQFRDMELPGFKMPPPDSIPGSKKRRIYRI